MSIRCIRNAAGIYGKYGEYTKYEIDSSNINNVYELLYNNIQVRNEIICCNENGGCSYYTSGDIHTSLYIKCDFSCDYDVINNKIYDSNIELKRVSTKNVILANISFELFKNIICFFKDRLLGIYDDDILELLQKDNKFILNMRSECYDYLDSDTDTDTDIDTNVEIEPL